MVAIKFNIRIFQGRFTYIQCICLKWPVPRKRLVGEAKRTKIWDSEVLVLSYFDGDSMHLHVFQN